MKRMLLLFFMTGGALAACAQDSTRKKNRGGEFYLFGGLQYASFDQLDNRLQSASIPETPNTQWSSGFGFGLRFSKVIVGAELAFFTNVKENEELKGMVPTFYISTNAIQTKRTIFSPRVGIGYTLASYTHTAASTAADFNGGLTTSRNQVQLEYRNPSLDLGLTIKRKLGKMLVPYLRGGYRVGLKDEAWEIRNSNLAGPRDRGHAIYLQLVLGGGS